MRTFTERQMEVQFPLLGGDRRSHLGFTCFQTSDLYRCQGRMPQEVNELDGQGSEDKGKGP